MRIFAFLLTAVVAAAQAPRLSTPVLGYVFDRGSQSIRGVIGVPGSAGADLALPLEESLPSAFVNPALGIAVGTGKSGGVLVVRWGDGGITGQVTLTPAIGAPSRVAFPRGSDRALLISTAGAELIAGLSGTPASLWSCSAETLGGIPVRGAVSDDGDLAAVVLDTGQIVEVSADGPRVAALGSGALWAPGSATLLVRSGADLLLVGSDGSSLVASGLDQDLELAGVSGSGKAVLLNRKKGEAAVIDIATGSRFELGGLKPLDAQPLQVDGLYVIADAERGAFLLDTNASPPQAGMLPGIDIRRAP